MQTAYFVHALSDRSFAADLAEFLELGCNLTCYVEGGLLEAGQNIISRAEECLSADVVVLLLSPASSPAPWPRQRWEPLLESARREGSELVLMLLEDCPFPQVLSRRRFIDATANRRSARRLLKRWFWRHGRAPGDLPTSEVSAALEHMYTALSDRVGTLAVRGAEASQFVREAADEFEAVLWAPCHGRTLSQAAGELGCQLGISLTGPAKENCGRIRDLLARQRCLVVLDDPPSEVAAQLTAGGRTSTAVTLDAVRVLETPHTPAYARSLLAAKRYAEAYALLYELLDAVIDPEWCARELTWICEHWDRVDEANALRLNYGPTEGVQLTLF